MKRMNKKSTIVVALATIMASKLAAAEPISTFESDENRVIGESMRMLSDAELLNTDLDCLLYGAGGAA